VGALNPFWAIASGVYILKVEVTSKDEKNLKLMRKIVLIK
ncbi:hypothetical protein JGI25_01107, partial [Candidatus Kryptobacter tengchongensis]